ncbi:3644_t:CDS:1, partial [Funneliformis geosporum]
TDRTKLKKCDTIECLILFTKEAFRVHYTNYNVKAIKELDSITISYKVPSRSGKNIASRLSLGNNEQ